LNTLDEADAVPSLQDTEKEAGDSVAGGANGVSLPDPILNPKEVPKEDAAAFCLSDADDETCEPNGTFSLLDPH
jgi:hypothetical protein